MMGNLKIAGSSELYSETNYSTVCWLWIAHNSFAGHGLNLVYIRKHIQYST